MSRAPVAIAGAVLAVGMLGAGAIVLMQPAAAPAPAPAPSPASASPQVRPPARISPAASPDPAPRPVEPTPAPEPEDPGADASDPFDEDLDLAEMFQDLDELEADPEEEVAPPERIELDESLRQRGSPERRARFAEERERRRERLAAAERELKQGQAAARARLAAAAERARERSLAEPLEHAGQRWTVVGYGETEFVVSQVGATEERRLGWGSAPAGLALAVRRLGLDEADPAAHWRLGLDAAGRGEFAAARQAFARAAELDEGYRAQTPDLAEVAAAWRSFAGAAELGTDGLDRVEWSFSRDPEKRDFDGWGVVRPQVRDGALLLASPPHQPDCLAQVRGRWASLEVRVRFGGLTPRPMVGVSGAGALVGVHFSPNKVSLFPHPRRGDQQPLSEVNLVRLLPEDSEWRVRFAADAANGQLEIAAYVAAEGEGPVLRHLVPWQGPLTLQVGADRPGEVRLRRLRAEGRLDPEWRAAIQAVRQTATALALRRALRRRFGLDALPLAYAATSAEDAEGLAGIRPQVIELMARGRADWRAEREAQGRQAFRNAAAAGRDCAAAHYLYGRTLLASDPQAALRELELALALVEEFHEALAAKGRALLGLGRLDEARQAIDQALELAPDYAPGHLARALLNVRIGGLEPARQALLLADALAPTDPEIGTWAMRVAALRAGPRGTAEECQRPPVQELAKEIDDRLRRLFPQLAERSPTAPAPVLFEGPGELARYAYATTHGLPGRDRTVYDSASGRILFALPAGASELEKSDLYPLGARMVEQWLHLRGVSLPAFWVRNGLAAALADRPRQLSPHLGRRLQELVSRWDERLDLYDLLNETSAFGRRRWGLRFAQAWLLVDLCLNEEDDLGSLFARYLRLLAAPSEDPREQRGGKLERIYLRTFYELDPPALERRWAQHVAARCRRAGIAPPPSK